MIDWLHQRKYMTHYPTISTANTIIRLTATLDTNYKVHKEQQFQHHLQIAPLFALLCYVDMMYGLF